jgi:uncharacterized protein (TIGR03083 family)
VPTLAPSPAFHSLDSRRVLDLITAETARIAGLLAESDKDRTVPSCPGWTLDQLAKHVGATHRWVTVVVTRLSLERIERGEVEVGYPKDWAAVPEWFTAGGAALVDALSRADLDAPCYAFGADQHVRTWLRRMLHETVIHRIDAELAVLGAAGELDPAVAADNIDEFLGNVPFMARSRPQVHELHGDGETIHLHATDLDDTALPGEWLITLEPDGFRWSHAHVKGAAAVRGTVRDLALWVNHRLPDAAPGLERLGEEPLLNYWSSKTSF